MDDYNRYTWLVLLHTKDEAANAIRRYVAAVETVVAHGTHFSDVSRRGVHVRHLCRVLRGPWHPVAPHSAIHAATEMRHRALEPYYHGHEEQHAQSEGSALPSARARPL